MDEISTLKCGQYNWLFCICVGIALKVGSEDLRTSIDIMLRHFKTLWRCPCIVSLECWNLSWTTLLQCPCPRIIKHIPTDSSRLICFVCWSPYVCYRTLHNWEKTCGFILKFSWHNDSLPVKQRSNHIEPVCSEFLQGCLSMYLV